MRHPARTVAQVWRTAQAAAGRLAQSDAGGVVMEYVIVTCGVVLPLVGVSYGLFDASGSEPLFDVGGSMTGSNFGWLGTQFAGWYQRIMAGIAIPLP